MSLRVLAIVLLPAMLAGCASEGTLPPAPVLSLGDRICSPAPELGAAQRLELPSSKPQRLTIDSQSPCLDSEPDGRSSYAVFALPESPQPYQMDVASTPTGLSLFSPRLLLLDASGAVIRSVGRSQFQFRGGSLHGVVRMSGAERYVVIASDPQGIGETRQRIQTSTSAVVTSVGTFYSGNEAANTFTNAHNGVISIALRALPEDALRPR